VPFVVEHTSLRVHRKLFVILASSNSRKIPGVVKYRVRKAIWLNISPRLGESRASWSRDDGNVLGTRRKRLPQKYQCQRHIYCLLNYSPSGHRYILFRLRTLWPVRPQIGDPAASRCMHRSIMSRRRTRVRPTRSSRIVLAF
jgi:hypothetical protein